MTENKLLDLSLEFAVSIVNLVDGVTAPKSSYMTEQLARAGTSIGANIHEAQYAQSKKDFISKLEIALGFDLVFESIGKISILFRNYKNRQAPFGLVDFFVLFTEAFS